VAHVFQSVLNGVVLFLGPLMLLAAMGAALALLQRAVDGLAGYEQRHHRRTSL